MKRLIIIPLLFIFLSSFGQNVFYVSPRGNDTNDGSDTASNKAWLTWDKAFNAVGTVTAGDTVYFLGGVYNYTDLDGGYGYRVTVDGTSSDYIHFFNYPGHVPILDASSVNPGAVTHNYVMYATCDYIHFKGLTIRNVKQVRSDVQARAWYFTGGTGIIFEKCKAYNIEGHGFDMVTGNNVTYLNCDAWNCADSLGLDGYNPGGQGTGFSSANTTTTTGSVYFIGCRAWMCSDQGFSVNSNSLTSWDKCWSFNNGYLGGGGHGYKISFNVTTTVNPARIVTNCLGAYNLADGLTTNDLARPSIGMHIYNNTFYKNGSYGIFIYNTSSSNELELIRIFRNNISYANPTGSIFIGTGALYAHSNNTWDASPAVTVSDADFVSVDSTGLTGARGADGSLPVLTFLHLAEGSDLIAKGIGVGLVYDGDGNLWSQTTPSLGAYEYSATEPPEPPDYPEVTGITPVKTSATSISTGGTALNDGMGTISAKGVCWSTSINPTISDTHTHDGTGTTDYTSTITFLNLNTTYYIRSYITNETGTTYGASYQVVTPAYSIMKGTKVFVKDGKIQVIK